MELVCVCVCVMHVYCSENIDCLFCCQLVLQRGYPSLAVLT